MSWNVTARSLWIRFSVRFSIRKFRPIPALKPCSVSNHARRACLAPPFLAWTLNLFPTSHALTLHRCSNGTQTLHIRLCHQGIGTSICPRSYVAEESDGRCTRASPYWNSGLTYDADIQMASYTVRSGPMITLPADHSSIYVLYPYASTTVVILCDPQGVRDTVTCPIEYSVILSDFQSTSAKAQVAIVLQSANACPSVTNAPTAGPTAAPTMAPTHTSNRYLTPWSTSRADRPHVWRLVKRPRHDRNRQRA